MLGASRLAYLGYQAPAGAVGFDRPRTVSAYGDAQTKQNQYKFGASSIYLDGTGDAIKVTDATSLADFAGTGDFTYEGWFRFSTTSGTHALFDLRGPSGGAASMNIFIWGGTLQLYQNAFYNFGGTWSINTWYHIAVTKTGTTYKAFQNGTLLGSVTANGTLVCNEFNIGLGNDEVNHPVTGWVDEIRVSNSVRYTTSFTAPTAPFTTDANTLLLIHANGVNGGTTFTDDVGTFTRPLTIDAGSAISYYTAEKKFGSGSIENYPRDTSSNARFVASINPNEFDVTYTGNDWTFEYFFYPLGGGTYHQGGFSNTASGLAGLSIYTSDVNMYVYSGATGGGWRWNTGLLSGTGSRNAWNHVAVVQAGTTWNVYTNGVRRFTGTPTGVMNVANAITVGHMYNGGIYEGGGDCYFDEVRVSKTQRYTGTSYTVPTSAFTNDSDTLFLFHADSSSFADDNS